MLGSEVAQIVATRLEQALYLAANSGKGRLRSGQFALVRLGELLSRVRRGLGGHPEQFEGKRRHGHYVGAHEAPAGANAKDPLDDVRNTTSLRLVMKGGTLYDAETLDELWPEKKVCGRFPWCGDCL
jgi:hypothetical protein